MKFLEQIPRELTSDNIEKAIQDYLLIIHEIPLSLNAKDFLELMSKLKRDKINFGPYPTVTIFEAANRIMTDLTILFGIKQILETPIAPNLVFHKYLVEFGNEHYHQHDISASNEEFHLVGEAFNVSQSFFQAKKYSALKKLRKSKLEGKKIILVMYNAEAHSESYKPKAEANEYYIPVKIDLTIPRNDA